MTGANDRTAVGSGSAAELFTPLPLGPFSIIYADPPWHYQNYGYAATKDGSKAKRGVEKEYGTLSATDILSLPVASIAQEDSILFMWGTFPLLDQCIETMRAWGFTYKTLGFTWIKTYPRAGTLFWGMGNWTRSNPEVCLIGVRGKPKRASASVHSVVMAPIGEHSRKPDEVRQRIVSLCGDLPRIELFARAPAPGWEVWGNEV